MKQGRALLLLLSAALTLGAEEFKLLPEWARPHATAAAMEKPPEDADAWVLLDRTELAYAGAGEVRTRRYRLVKVLTERGISEGAFSLGGLGGGASKVKKLLGWNLREDGSLERINKDEVVTLEVSPVAGVSSHTVTTAVLPRVAKGSLVAFESVQTFRHPMGPVDVAGLLESVPIRRWELELAVRAEWFNAVEGVVVKMDLRHFQPWLSAPEVVPGQSVKVSRLPALPNGESQHPHPSNQLPLVLVRFLDPALSDAPPYTSWDGFARWVQGQYAPRARSTGALDLAGKDPLEGLRTIHTWLRRDFTYKQVYLTPERGWLPDLAEEVGRRRFGDCKDLAVALLAEVSALKLVGVPVLARIFEGEVEEDLPPSLTFNHVIAGIKLEQTLGLAAEVETPGGRYLLVDPTDSNTPLGQLGDAHRGGRVLICTEKGGLWAKVPDPAILIPRIRVEVQAEADPSGRLSGTIRYIETGDKLDLRSAARRSGKLEEYIARNLLSLPPTGTLTLVSQTDPRDIHKPFEVVVKAVHPNGFHRIGQEGVLASWGLPGLPSLIQKAGKPRVQAVVNRTRDQWEYHGEFHFSRKVQPVLPEKQGETAFRTYAWTAAVQPEGEGSVPTMDYRQARRDAAWFPPQQEQGVAEVKKDRGVLRAIHEDGLSVKVLP